MGERLLEYMLGNRISEKLPLSL